MNAGISLSNMMFWRFLIASIFMGVILIPNYKSVFKSWTENVKIILYGMAFYGPSAIVYFMSSRYVGTGLAMVIFFVYPAMVMLVVTKSATVASCRTRSTQMSALLTARKSPRDCCGTSRRIQRIGRGRSTRRKPSARSVPRTAFGRPEQAIRNMAHAG